MTRSLTLIALVAVAIPARADVIDLAFVRDQAAIGKAVKSLNAERVAVLKFKVQIGDRPATFDAGLANAKLPQKLENLLVVSNDTADPLLVLTGAADKADKLPPTTTWRDEAGRKALAGLTGLPLFWDEKQKLTPEALLCGQLRVAADFSSATVTLYAFTKANPAELKTIYTSPSTPTAAGAVKADRSILSLVGLSYALEKPSMSRVDGDTAAQRTAALGVGKPSAFTDTLARSPIKLTVLLNGKPVTIESDPDSPGGGKLPTSPKKGDSVAFKLTNAGDRKYAVVLAINGKNTNSMDKLSDLADRDPASQKAWLLSPGEETTLEGFYTDSKGGFNPFVILDDAQSAALYPLLGSRFRGLVTLHVFAEKAPPPPITPETPKAVVEEQRQDAELAVLSLGIGGHALDEARSSGGPDKAKERLQALTNIRPTADGGLGADPVRVASAERGLIVQDETRTGGGEIKTMSFAKDPNPVAFVQVRYYGK